MGVVPFSADPEIRQKSVRFREDFRKTQSSPAEKSGAPAPRWGWSCASTVWRRRPPALGGADADGRRGAWLTSTSRTCCSVDGDAVPSDEGTRTNEDEQEEEDDDDEEEEEEDEEEEEEEEVEEGAEKVEEVAEALGSGQSKSAWQRRSAATKSSILEPWNTRSSPTISFQNQVKFGQSTWIDFRYVDEDSRKTQYNSVQRHKNPVPIHLEH